MIEQATVDFSRRELIDEVRRYLEAVDAFRAEGQEPHWRPERVSYALQGVTSTASSRG